MKSKEIRVSKIGNRRGMIAELYCEDVLIYDIASALEVAMTTSYETDSDRLILNKEMIDEEFFDLDTGLAKELCEKFENYSIKIAIYGDFSDYSEDSFHQFMLENNKGKDFFFAETREEAISELEKA